MKRGALPAISASGEVALNHYERVLRTEEDLSAITIRNDHDLYSSNEKRSAKGSREDRLGVIHEEIERGNHSWQQSSINRSFARP